MEDIMYDLVFLHDIIIFKSNIFAIDVWNNHIFKTGSFLSFVLFGQGSRLAM